jgi:hypothetical protein
MILAVVALLAAAPAAQAEVTPPARSAAPSFTGRLPALPAPVFFGYDAADALVPEVAWYDAPGAAAPSGSLTNPTWEGWPLAFLVYQTRGDWLQVRLPARPNGTLGWIHRADVNLRPVLNRIVIELEARRLTVFHGNGQLFQSTVAIGSERYPTPTGDFFVDIVAKPVHPNGAYGVTILSVAGFSDVLERFGGGIGQIAIHGTNQPGLIGQAVSHGCVRMTNDDILQVEALAPVGTPVTILP